VVSVNRSEIELIAEYIGTTPEAAVRLYTVPDPEVPALRPLRNSKDGCVFLDGNVCMIYEARPKTCRDFPYVAVGTHSLGGRQSSLARWATLCPIIFNALERSKHLTGYHPHSLLSTNSKPSVCANGRTAMEGLSAAPEATTFTYYAISRGISDAHPDQRSPAKN
jgi:Fe-S-cluster containining protein